MKKKFLISLAPLAVIAAFAVAPVGAQAACVAPACPHEYQNGAKVAEGVVVRTIAWGTLHLKNATLGEVTCHNIFAGFAENPTGGGAASGKVQAFFPYECESATCIALGGKGIAVTAGKMPWVAEADEPVAGQPRQKTGFKGTEKEKKPPPSEPGYVEFNVNCEGVVQPTFFGESNPLIRNNGKSIGASPGELKFTPKEANEPELESEALKGGETEGTVKTMGYTAQSLLAVHNP